MKEKLETLVREALGALGVEATAIVIERPAEMAHGDYATNVALAYAKKAGMAPKFNHRRDNLFELFIGKFKLYGKI
ncbi:MAG: hypothetical protein AAB552_01680 [Patescibacteria group bacterium]